MTAPLPLHKAADLAERIRDQLAEFCLPERCAIVGSIRRAREYVNDIDLALIPKPGQKLALLARAKLSTIVISEGNDIVMLRLKNGTQLDLYFAHNGTEDLIAPEPSNWASVLVCRTGSKEHNVKLCTRARELGLKWETMRGLVVVENRINADAPGALLPAPTEEQFFAHLNMEFIPPVFRR
jgi:DNA polymerase (family X)